MPTWLDEIASSKDSSQQFGPPALPTISEVVVGEGAAPSRLANLAISGVYKTPLHGWCYPPWSEVVLLDRISRSRFYHPVHSRRSSSVKLTI
jgi:hypothetical protein